MLLTVRELPLANRPALTLEYRYGWCGNTAAYCGDGCISGCTQSSTPPASTGGSGGVNVGALQPSTTTTAEPVIGQMSTTMDPGAAATGAVTTDGESPHEILLLTRWNKILLRLLPGFSSADVFRSRHLRSRKW